MNLTNNPTNNNNNYITVILANNSDEALRQWVPNGCTTFFMVFTENLMILRSTDYRGMPSQPRFFLLTEKTYNQQEMVQTIQNGDSNYVSKAEFDELKALIIASMNNPQPNNQPQNNKEQGYKSNKRGGNN